jgi:bis(5'-nucleosidyl)-tetraphosphatase
MQQVNNRKKVKRQVVAGFVVFRRTEEGVKFLLLYRRGNYWNFPKGHFEEGEDSMATALRETQEETGIRKEDLRIIPGFKAYEKFYFVKENEKIHDTVILYLAETKKAEVVLVPREHSGFAWFLYPDTVRVLGGKYVGTKRVLKLAHDFIRGKSNQGSAEHKKRHDAHVRRSSRQSWESRSRSGGGAHS